MEIDLNVLSPSMKDWIRRQVCSPKVIAPQNGRSLLYHAKFFE
jgi:hypothetical protein